jgi:hypothetical protein
VLNEHDQLAQLAIKHPKMVFCLLTTLQIHGLDLARNNGARSCERISPTGLLWKGLSNGNEASQGRADRRQTAPN